MRAPDKMVQAATSPSSHQKNASAQCAGLILMYHRIGVAERDPWGLAVAPDRFEQHLQRLRNFGQPAPLGGIVASLAGGECPCRAIAVTFDDGYADNLHAAAPLLGRYDVPATVFVTTGYIGAGREFWWDELERILLSPVDLPDEFSIALDKELVALPLGEARHYSAAERRADRGWFRDKAGAPSPRFAFFRAVHGRLMSLSDRARRAALDQVGAWAGDAGGARGDYLCLSRDELATLAKWKGVTLGAHTVTHVALPAVQAEAQKQEIRQSRMELEALTGEAVSSFAYPFGSHSDETVELARHEGFSCACSTRAGTVAKGADVFSLPRIKVGDWDGETFEQALAAWLPLLQ